MANGGYYFISGKLVYQRDDTAEGIINTIQITDGVTLNDAQKFYVRYIVTNLIRAGIWSKIKALYGFVGGTAATHRWNWKDMRDLDVAYRILWSGGITHNNLGVKGDGINGWGDTNIVPNTLNSFSHLSFYSNTVATKRGVDLGSALNNDGGEIFESLSSSTSIEFALGNSSNGVFNQNLSISSFKGFKLSQNNGTSMVTIGNDVFYRNTSSVTPIKSSTKIALMIRRIATGINTPLASSRPYQYFSIGDGLTDMEAIQLSNIITFAQGILGRQ